jgi:hypothetical protein
MTRLQVTRPAHITLAVIAAVLIALVAWSGQVAQAQELNWTGRITSMPGSGLVGQWTVGGRTFIAGAGTEFRQDKGALAVGVCAEVEYVGAAEPFSATKIASKSDDDCASVTPTPSTTPSVTPSTTPEPEREAYGLVQNMPSPGFIGDWVIGGITYRATAGTEFKQRSGPLGVGACAKVHYTGAGAPFAAREIESRPASDCNGSTPTVTITPGATVTPGSEIERYGRIDSFPAGLIGAWVVGGISYNATAASEFKQEDGAFAVGVCVKLHAFTTTSPATIREVESERSYRCGEGGGEAESEVYGTLQSFPAGLIGAWNIAGMTYVADAGTEFKQENGPFAVGMTVKVHFTTDAAGVNRAREIETKFANDDNGQDDDGNGSFEGAEGHAYGIAGVVPTGLIGDWSISGIDYTATEQTRFEQSDGPLVQGARVKVEYYLDAGGKRIAGKIESTDDNGDVSVPSNAKVFGFVDQMPNGGLVGTWVIDNVAYAAGPAAKFKEDNAVLGVGAYVAVEYAVQGGQNQVHEIEAHVPPGAGPQLHLGRIDDRGGAGVASAAADGTQAGVWIIGGVSYRVLAATDLNDSFSALQVGDTALVNSYTAADGALVATQIKGITINSNLYLPAVQR